MLETKVWYSVQTVSCYRIQLTERVRDQAVRTALFSSLRQCGAVVSYVALGSEPVPQLLRLLHRTAWQTKSWPRRLVRTRRNMHKDQVKRRVHTTPSALFLSYNSCLQTKHALYCCFICNQLILNTDLTHVTCCFQQHCNACCNLGLDFEHICVFRCTSLEQ